MKLTPNKVYKIQRSNLSASPILVRNPNAADLFVGLQEIVGEKPEFATLDSIGHISDLYAIVDMIKCCDFIATSGEDVCVVGIQVEEI